MDLYVRLTDKCNMSCDHCAFSCTGKGTFMSREVFEACLSIAKEHCGGITLGGGEPTLHPKCLEWTMDAALATLDASMDLGSPATLIITNGKKTDVAIKLAKLGHLGVIQAEVSRDMWHDPIDEKVFAEFSRYNKGYPEKGHSGIRNVEGGVKARGRAIENGLADHDGCACSALCIDPNGDFYQCGCRKTKLGNVLSDPIPQQCFDFPGECEDYVKDQIEELEPA